MKRTLSEKGLVVVLFVMVLTIFSLADRDSKKLAELYNTRNAAVTIKKDKDLGSVAESPLMAKLKSTRN